MSNAQAKPLDPLHADVDAFTEEMRQARQAAASTRSGLVPFALGAVSALAAFGVAILILKV
jgi:hypothetical protein